MCAVAELVRLRVCLKQIRPDCHYFVCRSVGPLKGVED